MDVMVVKVSLFMKTGVTVAGTKVMHHRIPWSWGWQLVIGAPTNVVPGGIDLPCTAVIGSAMQYPSSLPRLF